MYLDPITNTKICSNPNCEFAGKPQPAENFPNNKAAKDGKCEYCRKCLSIKRKKLRTNPTWVQKKSQQDKQYREKNKKKKQIKDREYRNAPAKYDLYVDKLSWCEETRRDPSNPDLLQVQCSVDHKWFNPSNQMVRMRIATIYGKSQGWARFYCSDQCKEKCSDYGQKAYPKGYKKYIPKKIAKELSDMVFKRDNWECQRCGDNINKNPDIKLHCHHIDPIVCNPIESADIDNCITFCESCHDWIHQNIPKCGYGYLVHIHYQKIKEKNNKS